MKKIIKVFVFSMFVLFISGCDVNYNLDIDKDLSVKEIVIGLEQNYILERNNNTKEKQVQAVIDTLDLMGELISYNKTPIYNASTSGVSVDHSFLNMQQYSDSSTLKDSIFKNFDVTSDINSTTINSSAVYISRKSGIYEITVTTINIKIPYKVINHNADKVDKNTNTYTWNMTSKERVKSIKITYANNSLYKGPTIIEKGISSIGLIPIIIIPIIVIAIVFGLSWIIINNKNNNKF